MTNPETSHFCTLHFYCDDFGRKHSGDKSLKGGNTYLRVAKNYLGKYFVFVNIVQLFCADMMCILEAYHCRIIVPSSEIYKIQKL